MRSHPLFAAVYDAMTRQMEDAILAGLRARLVASLDGDVLEIGTGTGATLAHYRAARWMVAGEPDCAMLRRLSIKARAASMPVSILGCAAEALPFGDHAFDAAVCTCVLCSVSDLDGALAETRRVLKPGGRLAILEHVRAEGQLAAWQDRLTPLWSRLVPGCHLNRDVRAAVVRADFTIEWLEMLDPFPSWVAARPLLCMVAVLPA